MSVGQEKMGPRIREDNGRAGEVSPETWTGVDGRGMGPRIREDNGRAGEDWSWGTIDSSLRCARFTNDMDGSEWTFDGRGMGPPIREDTGGRVRFPPKRGRKVDGRGMGPRIREDTGGGEDWVGDGFPASARTLCSE